MKILKEEGLSFDDVLLVPQHSTIQSRFGDEIDLSCSIGQQVFKYPIISSNMDTITECCMANTMNKLGGLGIVHRFMSVPSQYELLSKIEGFKVGCIGVGQESKSRATSIKSICDALLIDVAHGDSEVVFDQIKWLKDKWPELPVIAGNICTYSAAINLINLGVSYIKIGVGPGSMCSTRIQTGCGVPQLTAIADVASAIPKDSTVGIIADGGIASSGSIVKALAAGANMVMIGNLFAGTDETPGEVFHNNKWYRGQASRMFQEEWKGKATSIEGVAHLLPCKGSVVDIFKDLISGILSGMSYLNARNLAELRENAVFIRQTSSGYRESTPHGLK